MKQTTLNVAADDIKLVADVIKRVADVTLCTQQNVQKVTDVVANWADSHCHV